MKRTFLIVAALLFVFGLAPLPAQAAIPEVQGVTQPTKPTLQWAAAPGVDAYDVYRGNLTALRSSGGNNYGVCIFSGLVSPMATDATTPSPGQVNFYMITGTVGVHEGTMGYKTGGAERPNLAPCLVPPLPLRDEIHPNGAQPDGVIQGVEAPRNPGIANDLTGLVGGGLYLHTGEYFAQVVDLEIPGRGISWRHVRSYRSQINHNGQQGYNWTFNYDRRIVSTPSGIAYLDGTGRQDEYLPSGPGWEPVDPGIYTKIVQELDGTFTLRERDGTLYHHYSLAAGPVAGSLFSIEDRLGNRINFLYYPGGLLKAAVDTQGREIDYYWNAQGRLHRVVDYRGRELRYAYDANGNLTKATSPAVTGTSTGNDFPAGKATDYGYSSGTGNPMLDHNLLTVRAPGDAASVVQNSYNPSDELQTQFYGGTNASGIPAGGVSQYQIVPTGFGTRDTTVFDRNGVQTRFTSDSAGHVTREELFTLGIRPGDPLSFVTQHYYTPTGERQATFQPLNNYIYYQYDDGNFDRFQRGNLLAVQRNADPSRGDGFGGFLPTIVASYAYDALYNQQRRIVDPLGRASDYTFDYQEGDPSTNGVFDLTAKWNINTGSTPLFVGDANGDGLTSQANGSPVLLTQPTVSLLPAGRQEAIEGGSLQPIRTVYRYNAKGQLVVEIDPENNVTVHQYYPETDPDGDGTPSPTPIDGRILDGSTGGYLAITTLDANPAPYLTPVEVARRDNATNPAPAQIRNDYAYDAVGNLVRSIDGNGAATTFEVNQLGQIVSVHRGAVSFRSVNLDSDPPPAGFIAQQIYDARNEIVTRSVQDLGDLSATGGFVDTTFVYDALGRQVSMTQEQGGGIFATTQYRWDPQGNRTATIFPEGNIFTMQPDERGMLYKLVRGDNDLLASNGGPVGSSMQTYNYDANGNPTEFIDGRNTSWAMAYDGMDRRVRAHNFPGTSYFDTLYNADESISQIRIIENNGGEIVRYDALPQYDELGRVKEIKQSMRDPLGNLIFTDFDGDGYVSGLTEYDRNSRRSRAYTDNRHTNDYWYDGASRMVRKVDAMGNQASLTYDAANNVLQMQDTEIGPAGTETFLTTSQYDRLGRVKSTTDNAGNTKSLVWDSRDNLIQSTDALGNTIAYQHNGLNRLSKIIRDLRVGGKAPGAVYDQIIYQYAADRNSRLTSATDPNGNATTYQYDALDRKIKDVFADATSITYTYDPNDNVTQVQDANGSTVSIVYDLADRPMQRSVAPAAGVHANSQTYFYDAMNRLVRAIDQNDAGPNERTDIQFTYDSLNNILTERSQFGAHPIATTQSIYLGNGTRYGASGPSDAMNYTYDALDRLVHVDDTVAGFSANYTYMGPDRVATRQHGNGTKKSYLNPAGTIDIGYDAIKRVKSLRHYSPVSVVQAGFDYTYDPMGNITSETRLHHSGRGDVYVYDSAYRIADFKRDVDNPVAELNVPGTGGLVRHRTQYTLDRVGNWVSRVVDGVTKLDTPNNLNEYDENQSGGTRVDDGIPNDFDDLASTPGPDGVNLGHDKNGDLKTEGQRTYEYDAYHRLVMVRNLGAPVAHYVYDGLNRRIAKQDFLNAIDYRYVWDQEHIIVERNFAESITRKRFFPSIDTEMVALQLVSTNTLYYVHEDVRGSTVMLTDPAGNVVERVVYDAFGVPEFQNATNTPTGATSSAFGNPFLYMGQYYDPETQLYEKRGAMFAPRMGRHLQRFVPGQHIGPMGMALNPPWFFPCPFNWIGLNPFWWNRAWFWHPGAWFGGGWWGWHPFWWWGGAWGWWAWQPWIWFGAPGFAWWFLRPWVFWWHAPFNWWGWQSWWVWPGWWGYWPFFGWFGWSRWLPVWGWLGWQGWWPFWNWWGWWGWWPACGWWGWWGWWPWWNVWWCWNPWWWWGWWTWMPFIWHGFWGWSGLSFWWNWWGWIRWWPWAWWHWIGWFGWWGWFGWNPWWFWGWGGWWMFGWMRGWFWWWGPIGWWPWFCWGWWGWWWCGWWGWWLWIWGCWIWRIGWWGFWGWAWGWAWNWGWLIWPWWRFALWWGCWWPWWGWWC